MIYDLILVGGGLANSLIAWRLAQRNPMRRMLILEQGHQLGGNHTWAFHCSDLTPAQHTWLKSLISYEWERHEVRFPRFCRVLHSGYQAMTSEHLHRQLVEHKVAEIRFAEPVQRLEPSGVWLASGAFIPGGAIIDGRGPRNSRQLILGFQKFLGLEIQLERPSRLRGPIIMDATVSQQDGYRFLYVLPLAPQRILVEDTRYSDGADLDETSLRQDVLNYVHRQGWRVANVKRLERGVLPILLAGDLPAFWAEGAPGVARSGLNAALFHPTTGYSLPYAVRLADKIAASKDLSGPSLHTLTYTFAGEIWRKNNFFRLLNRMLFRAGRPEHRYRVLEHFYRLPKPLIERFYAGQLILTDKARLLIGKPPVPIREALGCLSERALLRRERGKP